MQTSESYTLGALLSFSGGLQDAYTYTVRGRVFANAQTGNVVLMSQNFFHGDFAEGGRYLMPLAAFAGGIFLAETLESHLKQNRGLHWRQIIVFIEIAVLFAVGLMPARLDLLANMLVSFSCALQVQTFRKVHGYGYASTMCIGNLRSGTESLSRYLREKDKKELKRALIFFGILFVFAIGAGVGSLLSELWGIEAIWVSALLLTIAAVMMEKETR